LQLFPRVPKLRLGTRAWKLRFEWGATKKSFAERVPKREFGNELKAVNERLWAIEDEIPVCEREQDFGPRCIALARSVYHENDRRAALKKAVNQLRNPALSRRNRTHRTGNPITVSIDACRFVAWP